MNHDEEITGGQAFPGTIPQFSYQHPEPGMTLRDWFAGQALASGDCPFNVYQYSERAKWCYGFADAMIAERNKL